MKFRDYAVQRAKSTALGARLVEDKRYRAVIKAVVSLIFNLLFALYNGILGIVSASLIFVASSAYYLLLCAMRFSTVMLDRKRESQNDSRIAATIGILLMVLSLIFHIMVIVSMKFRTAAQYSTIPMITIATFTFTKITTTAITAVKHRMDRSGFYKAVNAIRYSEVAVSLLTMQQSMLVSFGEGDDTSAVILNACTGAGVCIFIFVLGIILIKNSRKEKQIWQNQKS